MNSPYTPIFDNLLDAYNQIKVLDTEGFPAEFEKIRTEALNAVSNAANWTGALKRGEQLKLPGSEKW